MVNQTPALLTGHHYPLGCEKIPAPTITQLLSPKIRRAEGVSLDRYMSVARASETPFRLDETNTVSCGGVAGISNTFASALWAVSYLTQTMGTGAAGINLQGNPANCGGYTPVCAPTPEALATGALGAQPEWYALLLAKALIGDRPLPVRTSSPGHPNVEVTSFLARSGRLHFVVVDDDPPGAHRVSAAAASGKPLSGREHPVAHRTFAGGTLRGDAGRPSCGARRLMEPAPEAARRAQQEGGDHGRHQTQQRDAAQRFAAGAPRPQLERRRIS